MGNVESLAMLIKNLSNCPDFESLSIDIMWGFIRDSGITLISEALVTCLNLKTLDLNLRDNKITRQGIEVFAGSLVSC